MYGDLTDAQINKILATHRYGRVGFVYEDEVFIVPINYGYDGHDLYCQARPGTKIDGMRHNPHVGFQVDEIRDPAHWQSVLLQGRYVELFERREKEEGYRWVLEQAGGGERSEVSWAIPIEHLVVFKIELVHRYGRFERRQAQGRASRRQHDEWPLLGR